MEIVNSLVVTTLYPNLIQFRHGVFVETRIKYLKESGVVNIKVIAPVPWFPCKSKYFPGYSKFVDIPQYEVRHGIDVYHPRYIVFPKIGMLVTPLLLAISIYGQIKRLQKKGYVFDVMDAHYYYPDGVAAAIVASLLNKPLTITARGTDINLIPTFRMPRKLIVWASKIAKFNLAVCDALRRRMLEIGMDQASTRVLRNGVDLTLFKPLPRDAIKQAWSSHGRLLISVGNLLELKGHHLVIEAMTKLPDCQLFIIGGGEWEERLKNQVQQLSLQGRVRFLGEVYQEQLSELYSCADALILASSREGWPNVLLEAMACGTPVIATSVGACQEIVNAPEAGVLCAERSAQGIVAAVNQLFSNYPDRAKTRRYAEKFSWDETTTGLVELFSEIKQEIQVRSPEQ